MRKPGDDGIKSLRKGKMKMKKKRRRKRKK